MKATYHSYWLDKNSMIHHITASCEINYQSQELYNFTLNKNSITNMKKLFEYVIPDNSNTGRMVGYGSIQPSGFTGVWLDKKLYSWLANT